MDCHIAENSTRNCNVCLWGWTWIARGNDYLLHISNVALFNQQTQKADRASFKTLEGGRKVRAFKSNGEQIDA